MSEIEQVNTPNGRYYKLDGKKLPSVTAITGLANRDNTFLKKWLSIPENQQAANESATFGRCVHIHLESYFKGFDDSSAKLFFAETINKANFSRGSFDQDEIDQLFTKSKIFFNKIFLAECELIKESVCCIESCLYSECFLFAGTIDLVLKVYDPVAKTHKAIVIDFKTSSKRKSPSHLDGYKMQLAAYSAMVKERLNLPISHARLIIGVTGNDTLQAVEIGKSELKMNLMSFLHYRDLYYEEKGF